MSYYNSLNIRMGTGVSMSKLHTLKRGIITVCTMSATLFALAMNMTIKFAEKEYRCPVTKNESQVTIHESLHGWHDNNRTICNLKEMNIKRARRTHHVGENEFQSGKIKVTCFVARQVSWTDSLHSIRWDYLNVNWGVS